MDTTTTGLLQCACGVTTRTTHMPVRHTATMARAGSSMESSSERALGTAATGAADIGDPDIGDADTGAATGATPTTRIVDTEVTDTAIAVGMATTGMAGGVQPELATLETMSCDLTDMEPMASMKGFTASRLGTDLPATEGLWAAVATTAFMAWLIDLGCMHTAALVVIHTAAVMLLVVAVPMAAVMHLAAGTLAVVVTLSAAAGTLAVVISAAAVISAGGAANA